MRIFQIGFNECGAGALGALFQSCGVRTLFGDGQAWRQKGHTVVSQRNPQLILHANLRAGRPALQGLEDFQAFFGMEYVQDGWNIENFRHFAQFAEEDPTAKFILNTGDADDWLQARLLRSDGACLDQAMSRTGMSRRGVLNLWADDFHRHHDMVRECFRDHPGRLFEFDMQHTPVKDLARFVRPDIRIWPWRWRQIRPATTKRKAA